ncbi:MAG: hypothetical protein ACREQY_23460 [Candidatus Binatia bacterium]
MSEARFASGKVSVRAMAIVAAAIAAAVFGWHVQRSRSIGEAAAVFIQTKLPGVKDPVVSVDPVTNVVSVTLERTPKRGEDDPLSALGHALSSALGTAIASAFEPALERELNLQAREQFDLYAMLLGYRVRIVENAGD